MEEYNADKARATMRDARLKSGEFTKALNAVTMGIADAASIGDSRVLWRYLDGDDSGIRREIVHVADQEVVVMVCDELKRRGFIFGSSMRYGLVSVRW